jgi:hypothetical protein
MRSAPDDGAAGVDATPKRRHLRAAVIALQHKML